jgi:hypothetical protein
MTANQSRIRQWYRDEWLVERLIDAYPSSQPCVPIFARSGGDATSH